LKFYLLYIYGGIMTSVPGTL